MSRRGDCVHEIAFVTSAAGSGRVRLSAVVHAAILTLCTGQKNSIQIQNASSIYSSIIVAAATGQDCRDIDNEAKSDLYIAKTERHRVSAEQTLQSDAF